MKLDSAFVLLLRNLRYSYHEWRSRPLVITVDVKRLNQENR